MSHLLAIAVGPVQEFIAAARRTRDLWFGSYLLSEISKAVAKSVKDRGGELIFPHRDTDLTAGDDKVNVANVILAELPAGDPRDVAAKAKHAAKDCWEKFANEAKSRAGNAIVDTIWNEQINGVIEFYAAWVPHPDPNQYAADRNKLMRLLAGRKNCRDFPPANGADVGIPKSSLDGQRPSVFEQPQYRSQRDDLRATWPKLLRLAPGEELDVVGVTKRLGKKRGESHPSYSSVARVAAETWLQGVRDEAAFEALKTACEALRGLNKVAESNYQYFPFEGTVIYKDRHTDLQKELGLDATDLKPVTEALKQLGGEPNPYLAVLRADGDKIGAAISNLPDAEANRRFSQALAEFAAEARKIVHNHNGVLVYAGGDDVLAFLPVDKCLSCARKLHDDFGDRLAKYGNPTLSVGIAVGHFMENLEDLLEYGRAAEKAAKSVPGKDALAVHLHKRGSAPIPFASRWGNNPDQALTLYAELIQADALPSKLPYDLLKLVDLYRDWPETSVQEAMQRDALRIIADKQPRAGRRYMRVVRDIIKGLANVAALQSFCDQLLIARLLAEVFHQANRSPTMLTPDRQEVPA